MNDGWPLAHGHDRWGGGPTSALAEAVGLVERATGGLRASGAVAWEARAAELYRAEVAEVLEALVRDGDLLDATMRQAGAAQAAPFPHTDGPHPEGTDSDGLGQAGGAAVPHTIGARSW
ncbi:hypothetical protein ACFS27_09930 [Promicromonospora vindobonensis]|uniref:Uncharacterized protein n=1 Tax=Promicromonospora vindobonensis TaxID=195748 RepID=A0ABW5VRB5_9MICO